LSSLRYSTLGQYNKNVGSPNSRTRIYSTRMLRGSSRYRSISAAGLRPSSAANPPVAAVAVDVRDRQTDGRTDGRTVCRFMTLIKYYAERVTTCEVAAAAAVAADTSLLTTHQYSSAGGTMTNACRATNYQRHCWLATLPHAPSQFALPSHRRFPPYGPPRPPSFLVAVRGRQPGHPPDPFGRTSSADCRPHGYLGYLGQNCPWIHFV